MQQSPLTFGFFSGLWVAIFVFCAPMSVYAQPVNPPFVEAVELISNRRISRTVFEYSYRVRARNPGAAVSALSFVAHSSNPAIVIVDGDISVGSLGTGETRLSNDTFVVQLDRQIAFNALSLDWRPSYELAPTAPTIVLSTTESIGPAGGTVSLSGIATVTLIPNPNRPVLDLELSQVLDESQLALFDQDFPGRQRTDWLIRVHSSENLLDPVHIDLQLPAGLMASAATGTPVQLFALLVQKEPEFDEMASAFEAIPSNYARETGLLSAVLPSYVFTPTGSVETFVLASTSAGNAVAFQVVSSSPNGDRTVPRGTVIPVSGSFLFNVPPQLQPSPSSPVSSFFGERNLTGQPERHGGIDIGIASGGIVSAAAAGRVIRAGSEISRGTRPPDCGEWQIGEIITPNVTFQGPICKAGFGHRITVQHLGGCQTTYGHLVPFPLFPLGGDVGPGQFVGFSDNTGRSSGPHLHFEYRGREGALSNPLRYVNNPDASPCLEGLSAVVKVFGSSIDSTRRQITKADFSYAVQLNTADPLLQFLVPGIPVLVNVTIEDAVTGRAVDAVSWHLTLEPDDEEEEEPEEGTPVEMYRIARSSGFGPPPGPSIIVPVTNHFTIWFEAFGSTSTSTVTTSRTYSPGELSISMLPLISPTKTATFVCRADGKWIPKALSHTETAPLTSICGGNSGTLTTETTFAFANGTVKLSLDSQSSSASTCTNGNLAQTISGETTLTRKVDVDLMTFAGAAEQVSRLSNLTYNAWSNGPDDSRAVVEDIAVSTSWGPVGSNVPVIQAWNDQTRALCTEP